METGHSLVHGDGMLVGGGGMLVCGDGMLVHGDGMLVGGGGMLVYGVGMLVCGDGMLVHGDEILVYGDGMLVRGDGMLVCGGQKTHYEMGGSEEGVRSGYIWPHLLGIYFGDKLDSLCVWGLGTVQFSCSVMFDSLRPHES